MVEKTLAFFEKTRYTNVKAHAERMMNTLKDALYWIWFAMISGAGNADAVRLLTHFPDARAIYEASEQELLSITDCNRQYLRRLVNSRDLTEAENILEFCFLNNIRIITCASDEYPVKLNDLYNKPIVLYARGNLEKLNERFSVAIVGTRNMTDYGKHAAFTVTRQLCGYGALIISGAAYGIDAVANRTALYFDCDTVAVLGTGVNVPYPAEHKELLDKIAEHGLVLSEFAPNTPPESQNFPIRNRIISGLADAVLVVEAGARSGALITARRAADQGRAVYGIPGNISSPYSYGSNSLIRDGAKLCLRGEDIVEDFEEEYRLKKIDRVVGSDKYLRYEFSRSAGKRQMTNSAKKPKPIALTPKAPRENPTTDEKRVTVKKAENQKVPASVGYEQRNKQEAHSPSADREQILARLNEMQKRVFSVMPDGEAVNADQIARNGIPAQDVMASLTMLELYAAVESLPGGLYKKLI